MSRTSTRLRHCALLISLALCGTARADIVIEETVDIDGAAGFSLIAMQGKSTTNLTADKSRTDSDMKFKSKLMNTFARKSGNSSQIVRLDEGRVFDLMHADKEYTEMTFAEMRAAMDRAMQQVAAAQEQMQATQQQQLPVDAEECQWSEPVVEAKETGETATIAGYETSRAVVTLKQTCTDPKTSKACDMVWTIDQWLASQTPGADEQKAFALNYARELGLDGAGMKAMQGRMQQAYGQYKSSWTTALERAAQFDGYPLKSALQMSMGGAQCTTESGTQVAADPMFADAAAAGMQAGASTAAGAAASAAGQVAAEQAGGGVAGSVAGSATGAFASKLGSSLIGKLRKKDKSPAEAPKPAEDAGSAGMIRLFRLSSETTAIRAGAIPAQTFEVPAEYRKVTPP